MGDRLERILSSLGDFARPKMMEGAAYMLAAPGCIGLGVVTYAATGSLETAAIATAAPVAASYVVNRAIELGSRVLTGRYPDYFDGDRLL